MQAFVYNLFQPYKVSQIPPIPKVSVNISKYDLQIVNSFIKRRL